MNNAKTVQPVAILARSFYRELENARYSPSDVVRFVNELLDLVTTDLQRARDVPKPEGDRP